jgi:diguanylate cyclase
VLIGFASVLAALCVLAGLRVVTSRHRALTHRASHDNLTDLLNRSGLVSVISSALDEGGAFDLLYLDLDRFKSINDSLGHAAGDDVLRVIGRRISDELPETCQAARLGGDEFVVVHPTADNGRSVQELAERLTRSIIEPIEVGGRLLRIGTSIGVARGPWSSMDPADAIGFANVALHRAKEMGRGRIEVFSPDMRADVDRRAAEESLLRAAVDAGDVVPFFQPEFEHSTGRLIGAEILARWVGPEGTSVSAASILEIVDDPSTLEKITASVVAQARPIIRRLDAVGLPPDFRFRVNIPHRCTPRAWRDGQIASALRGVEPNLLTIDIHESSRVDDPVAADAVLESLRSAGARVCLEDVTGSHTSLGSVPSLPLDEIRIDARHLDGPAAMAMARAVTGLAADLGLVVSATGVENLEVARLLDDLGCDRQQGFHHAPVLTVDQLEDEIMRDALKRVRAQSVA